MDRTVVQRVLERAVDELVLLDQREPAEARAGDGHVEVIAGPRPVDDPEVGRVRKGRAQQRLEALHSCETTCVPKPPVPPEIDAFLHAPNPAVVATLRPDGSPHTAATWYDWEAGRVLLNMDESRVRLRYLRLDPRVSLTVLGGDEGWYGHVTLEGVVSSLRDDDGLRDIDRLAHRYTGKPFGTRDRPRVSAWIDVRTWHVWPPG